MTSTTDSTETTDAVLLLVALVLLAPLMALDAVIFRTLWRWFCLPLGAPALSFWSAMGLLIVWAYLRHRATGEKEKDGSGERALRSILQSMSASIFALGLGWLVRLIGGAA
jgi:hypothetical protein